MREKEWKIEENLEAKERYELSIERLRQIGKEETTKEPYRTYFQKTAAFLLMIEGVRNRLSHGEQLTIEELQRENQKLYEDILPEQYNSSYANPAYAVEMLGDTFGQLLSAVYTELRAEIAYVFEDRLLYLTVLNELFVEIYNCFEETEEPEYEQIREIFYWFASDYCDVFSADAITSRFVPEYGCLRDVVTDSDLTDLRYLYQYGEYITDTELQMAEFMNRLPEETIAKIADNCTNGLARGFRVGGKDISKKHVVDLEFRVGFERAARKIIENFKKMDIEVSVFRSGVSILAGRSAMRSGFYGAVPNPQYEFDHRNDIGLIFDKKFAERKLDVEKNAFEKIRETAGQFAGPALIELFGQEGFSPEKNDAAVNLTKKQEELVNLFAGKRSQMFQQYTKGDERCFTIISYPCPEIGEKFPEIFDEVVKINTLDPEVYERIQQHIIDALDQGEYAQICGKGNNKTNLRVKLHPLQDPQKETKFENCSADVNIPAGEVFTSPVLEGTEGTLFVSEVYLHQMAYRNLEIHFQDGCITDYTCSNFDTEEDNKQYIFENILYRHETLPIGEFAIGTNTTAYAAAEKYGIADKYTILIAEKTGPHFAVGDTCYSWSEDLKVYNPDGKEIIAKDNSISIQRREDVSKAYFQCHTDITIPYKELAEISAVKANGEKIMIIQDGRFVLPGTEELNEPLKELEELYL